MLRCRKVSVQRLLVRNSSVFNGPDFDDFLQGNVKEASWADYQGKLKREVGDKRLKLPPWLKG